jgi:hypothetical protein
MEFLRACLFAFGVLVALAVIALLVAGIMKIIYTVVHPTKKKTVSRTETQPTDTGKVG